MAAGSTIAPGDLGLRRSADGAQSLENMGLEDVEAFLIRKAVTRYGSVTEAAKALGLSRSALVSPARALRNRTMIESRIWNLNLESEMALRFDRRIFLLTIAAGLPGTVVAVALLWAGDYSAQSITTICLAILVFWGIAASSLRHRIVFPLADDGESARGAARKRFFVSRARRPHERMRSARRFSRSMRSPIRFATNGWDRWKPARFCERSWRRSMSPCLRSMMGGG